MKPLQGETRLYFKSRLPTDAHEDSNLSSLITIVTLTTHGLNPSYELKTGKKRRECCHFSMTSSFTFHLRTDKKNHLPRTCRGNVRDQYRINVGWGGGAWQKERTSRRERGKKEGWRLETPLKFGPKRQTISMYCSILNLCWGLLTSLCTRHRIFNYDLMDFIISKSIVHL
jgi:hypothetical protein